MRPLFLVLAIATFTPFLLTAQKASSPEAKRLLEHVRYLASPELAGRGPGTDGNDKAAAYIAEQFKKAGVQPAAGQTFLQPFTMNVGAKPGKDNSATFTTGTNGSSAWKLGTDWQPYSFSENKSVSGGIVFAGYGLSHETYNDYKNVDVKDKIVIVLRGLPAWAKENDVLKGLAPLRTKATVARDKGAVAIVFVNEQGDANDVLAPFAMEHLGKNSGIVALQVRREACDKLFRTQQASLTTLSDKIDQTRQPSSVAFGGITAQITTQTEMIQGSTNNVVGMIPGTDPALANEVLVIGGHFDHLGMGDESSLSGSTAPAIHFGADDNASGTAGVIELAQRFARTPAKRPVVVMAFSGEEKGLIGSKYWTSTPTIPLDKVVTMINMDMIGRLKDNKLSVQGTGTSPGWPEILKRNNTNDEFTLSVSADGYGPSDHSSFTAKNIPVLFFFTGLHADYHRPTDTYDKINYDGEAAVLNYVERIAREIANLDAKPVFTKTSDGHGAMAGGEKKSASSGFRVTFGVIPDYSDDPQGLRITGVKGGGPAEKAGLTGDDVITKFGTTTIKNIYDLTAAMGEYKPGDIVDVSFFRGSEEKTVKVTLQGK